MRNVRLVVVGAGQLGPWLCLPLLLTAACGGGAPDSSAAERGAARPVKVERVQEREVRRLVDVVGTLAARDEVTVSAEVAGRVSRIVADLGDSVRQGDALVELDAEKYRYHVLQQQAALEQARARAGAGAEGELPPVERTPEVVSAEAEAREAEQQLARAEALAARKLLPPQQLEEAHTRTATTQAGRDAAIAAARQLRAQISGHEAALQIAERELRDTTVRAPFDALVAERLVSIGQFVQPQTPVSRLVRAHPLRLTAEVPEKFAPWLRRGRDMVVRVDAYPDEMFRARLIRIAPAVTLKSRAFPIEGDVPNPDGRLKPGTFARVQISTDRVERTLTVPVSAIQIRYGTNRVFVVRNGQVAAAEVRLGDRLGPRVEILDGVDAGTTIVAEDVEQLTDGTAVTPSG